MNFLALFNVLVFCICCASTSLLNATDYLPRPGSVPRSLKELKFPQAQHVNDEELQKAMQASVKAGVLYIIEEILKPANDSNLFYPPHADYKKIGEKTVEYRLKKHRYPIYETKTVKQMVPVYDNYGGIIKYEKRDVTVRASDKIVGWSEGLISDPNGDIVRTGTQAIYDRSNKKLPRGWFGINAQALLVLHHCGLGESVEGRKLANELERLMNMFGAPDATWDLAWVCTTWIYLADFHPGRRDRRDRLIGRLIDSALLDASSKHPHYGLWGPISVNHTYQARLMQVEIELQKLFDEIDATLKAGDKRKKKRLQAEFQKIARALGEARRANRHISQQGRRLNGIEMPWQMDENYKGSGLSYCIYNRDITDIDSSAMVAMALHEAAKRDLIPEITPRDKIQGKLLVKGVKSEKVFDAAYTSLINLSGHGGSYNTCTSISPIKAYDKVKDLSAVPSKDKLPRLLSPETWKSNIAAMQALHVLEPLASERSKKKIKADCKAIHEANRQRVLSILDSYLKTEPMNDDWLSPNHDKTDSIATLSKNNGWPYQKASKKSKKRDKDTNSNTAAVESLSVGYQRSPRALLEHLLFLHQDKADKDFNERSRQIAYRLLIEQERNGSWDSLNPLSVTAPGISSGEWSYLIGKLAKNHLFTAQQDKANKAENPLTQDFKRDGPYYRRYFGARKLYSSRYLQNLVLSEDGSGSAYSGFSDTEFFRPNKDFADTVAALLFLSTALKEKPTFDEEEIKAIKKRSQDLKTAHEQKIFDAQDAQVTETFTQEAKDEAIRDLEQSPPIMTPSMKEHRNLLRGLWQDILTRSGSSIRLDFYQRSNSRRFIIRRSNNDDQETGLQSDGEEEQVEEVKGRMGDILGE